MFSSAKNRLAELLKRTEAKMVELSTQIEEKSGEIDRQERARKGLEIEIDNLKEAAAYSDSTRSQVLTNKRELENEVRRLADSLEEANSQKEDLEAQVRSFSLVYCYK